MHANAAAAAARAPDAIPFMLLSPEAIFKDKPLSQLGSFFKNKLGTIQRARWRWCFPEPDDGVDYPRQRARNEIMDSVANWDEAEQLSMEAMEEVQPPHHKTAGVFSVGPKAAADWNAFCLLSTNLSMNKVPPAPKESPTSFNSIEVWLSMIKLAHAEALLKPGAMHIIEAWSKRCSEKQRAALSNIMLLFSDYLATGGSALLSETKIKYMPKSIPPKFTHVAAEGSLGRPTTAPIVSAVQLKMEAKLKAIEQATARHGAESLEKRMQEAMRSGGQREPKDPGKHPSYASTIPMKWPMKPPDLVTSTQAAMRQVNAGDARNRQFPSDGPPGTAFNRCIGGPTWHGEALYPRLRPVADASFSPLRPLASFAGFESMTRANGKPICSYRCN